MKYILPTLVFAFSSVSYTASAKDTSRDDTFRQLELFADVMARVRSEYVVDVNDAELIEGAMNGMLQSLDPHSSYVTPEQFKNMQTTTSGEYGGLGMEVTAESGVVKVVAPIDDSPAKDAITSQKLTVRALSAFRSTRQLTECAARPVNRLQLQLFAAVKIQWNLSLSEPLLSRGRLSGKSKTVSAIFVFRSLTTLRLKPLKILSQA